MKSRAAEILKKYFGYDTFRPLQLEIITALTEGKDVLAVMPTGGGKSLCYQIPAMLFPGLTIVVSPLISLMKDQVDQLKKCGIKAVCLNSSLPPKDYQENMQLCRTGEAKLLYAAPESLFKSDIQNMLANIGPQLFAVDEAHCISAWGHDFRREYRQLIRFRKQFPKSRWIALTATATIQVRQDILKSLEMTDAEVFIGSFNRKNLFLDVRPKANSFRQILGILDEFKDQSGIIYCFSRKQVDDISEKLSGLGYSVRPYHAGLSDEERHRNQHLFVNDSVSVIVATIAFGMGIDKPNVRFVIHNDLPKNLESYYQEIGRAGRDGLPSTCILLYNYGDSKKQMVFIEEIANPELKASAIKHLQAMVAYAEYPDCRRKPLLEYFGENFSEESCETCSNCTGNDSDDAGSDLSREARLFLSAVIEVDERFGGEHIIDILRGSSSEKIQKFRHDELASYGLGKKLDKKEWQNIRDQMLRKKIIKKDLDHYAVLRITPAGREVLSGKLPFYGAPVQPDNSRLPLRTKKIPGEKYDRDLFELLRKKRKSIAEDENVPPYIIFPDTTLIQMAQKFPLTRYEFSRISGVGEIKLEKYSGEFIPVIRDYLNDNPQQTPVDFEVSEEIVERRPALPKKEKMPTYRQAADMFNRGIPLDDIVAKQMITTTTAVNYLLRNVREGFRLSQENLMKLVSLPPEESRSIYREFKNSGSGQLKPVFDTFNGKYSYDDLKIYQILYINSLIKT